MRIIIGFPMEQLSGMRADAAQLALGLRACGHEVMALGDVGAWRDALLAGGVTTVALSATESARKIITLLKELDPQVVHTFGAGSSHRLLAVAAAQVGAGGVATLGHQDIAQLNPADFRRVSAVFVPCEHLREQLVQRLASTVSVIPIGYALPPAAAPPLASSRALAEELGVSDVAPLVLLAGDFDGGETEIARLLIEAAPLLVAHVPDIQLMIAGTGLRQHELVARAEEVNTQFGRRIILLPGSYDDLAPLLALTTVAIGSGRFAVEAQSAGVALVAAGAAGLVGTVTEESAQVAHDTCGGRHGRLEPGSVRALASEIIGLLSYPEYRRQFAAERQAALQTSEARETLAESIARYYRRAAPSAAFDRSPRRLTAILPADLRELLFTLPAISALRAGHPQATLRLITTPLHLGLLTQMGLATQVLLQPARLQDWPAFLRAQWRGRADICLAFSEDRHSALLALSSLASHRWGFIEGNGNLCLSDHLHSRLPASPERALLLTHALDISAGARVPQPTLLPETREIVQLSLLAAGVEYDDPLILLCPQVEESRAWPIDYWVELSARLLAVRPERVAVLGDPQVDWPLGVVKVMPVQDSLVLATLLARTTLVVAPDAAALHLAGLLGTPAVGLYGATVPAEIALPHSRCLALAAPEGIAEIAPEAVVAAIAELLPFATPANLSVFTTDDIVNI